MHRFIASALGLSTMSTGSVQICVCACFPRIPGGLSSLPLHALLLHPHFTSFLKPLWIQPSPRIGMWYLQPRSTP